MTAKDVALFIEFTLFWTMLTASSAWGLQVDCLGADCPRSDPVCQAAISVAQNTCERSRDETPKAGPYCSVNPETGCTFCDDPTNNRSYTWCPTTALHHPAPLEDR